MHVIIIPTVSGVIPRFYQKALFKKLDFILYLDTLETASCQTEMLFLGKYVGVPCFGV